LVCTWPLLYPRVWSAILQALVLGGTSPSKGVENVDRGMSRLPEHISTPVLANYLRGWRGERQGYVCNESLGVPAVRVHCLFSATCKIFFGNSLRFALSWLIVLSPHRETCFARFSLHLCFLQNVSESCSVTNKWTCNPLRRQSGEPVFVSCRIVHTLRSTVACTLLVGSLCQWAVFAAQPAIRCWGSSGGWC
jgi:hypothetical protein